MTSAQGPSHGRRQALLKMEENMQVSNFVNILRYYGIAAKLFQAFRNSVEQNEIDLAYILGKRYANFCTNSLPTHDYYNSPRPDLRRLRIENHRNLSEVAALLEEIVRLMDNEELDGSEQHQYNADLELPEPPVFSPRAASKPMSTIIGSLSIHQNSSIDNSACFTSTSLPNGTILSSSSNKNYNPSMMIPPFPSSSSTIMPTDSSLNNLNRSADLLTISSSSDNIDFPTAPAFSLSPSISQMSIVPTVKQDNKRNTSPEDLPISLDELCNLYSQEYGDFKAKGLIQIYHLTTHQGRIQIEGNDSANGCTVISSLIIKNHFLSSGPGVSDDTIEFVIDSEAPPILKDIRQRLGLQPHAMIIPSDVQNYFIEKEILKQEQFVDACGGNILDPEQRGELLRMLQNDNYLPDQKSTNCYAAKTYHKKIGVALFFHEHVICILKLVFPDGKVWYDLLDSLPRTNALKEKAFLNISYNSTRTRCKSIEALDATIRWYACSKFTESDKSYVDANKWDDLLCDFDPRVFQAFVWTERK